MTGATMITLECATKPQTDCGATVSDQAVEDKQTKQLVGVQKHPYICLRCWRLGWRSDAPRKNGDPWRIYRDEKAPQPMEGQ